MFLLLSSVSALFHSLWKRGHYGNKEESSNRSQKTYLQIMPQSFCGCESESKLLKYLMFQIAIYNWCATRIFKTHNTWLLSQGHWPLSVSLDCQIKKKWQQAIQQSPFDVNESKLHLLFLARSAKNVFLCVPQNFSNYFLCATR